MANQEQEQEQEQEQKPNPVRLRAPAGAGRESDLVSTGTRQGELLNASGDPAPAAAEVQTRGTVERVFAHWRDRFDHPKAVLDGKRRKVISSALGMYSESDLCQAIDGYCNSPHHMGHNDRNTVYDDITLFLRDAQHIDAGLRFASQRPRADLTTVTRGNIAAAEEAKRRLFGSSK